MRSVQIGYPLRAESGALRGIYTRVTPRSDGSYRMTKKSPIYSLLPERIKPIIKRYYYRLKIGASDKELHSNFVKDIFQSEQEYLKYIDEFESGDGVEMWNSAVEEYQRMTNTADMYGIGLSAAKDYYAVTRKMKPETVVETGVCNGVSTLSVLLALHKNGFGTLYSIDYPYYADESLSEFRQHTFDEYGGAAIPSDKEPGWLIPEELKTQWDLRIGKSQRVLPKLVNNLEKIDLFMHDSEHSHPCMMFEFELAYEWLAEGGVIIADDISWNEAFSTFTEVRKPKYGRISHNIGYVQGH